MADIFLDGVNASSVDTSTNIDTDVCNVAVDSYSSLLKSGNHNITVTNRILKATQPYITFLKMMSVSSPRFFAQDFPHHSA